MMMFLATMNTPGYLPWDDSPPYFETSKDAWDYLLDERRRNEDYALEQEGDGYSATLNTLESIVNGTLSSDYCDEQGAGSVQGDTPGYDGDHDLGIVYSVTAVEVEQPCRDCGQPMHEWYPSTGEPGMHWRCDCGTTLFVLTDSGDDDNSEEN